MRGYDFSRGLYFGCKAIFQPYFNNISNNNKYPQVSNINQYHSKYFGR